MKQIKRIMIVVLALVLAVSLSLTAFAATESQDGLELSVTTDKTSYSATEQVAVTVTVKNANAFAVSNVAVESNVPDGYKPADGYANTKNIATLGAGETATLTVVYVPESSGKPSGPSYPTYPPYPWYSGNTSNTGDAEETEEVVEIDQPTEGNTNVFEEVTVTAKRNVGLWVLIAVVSAGALIAVLAGKKRFKKTMSIMLCIAMVGTLVAVLPVEVNAETLHESKDMMAMTSISIDGESVDIGAIVFYDLTIDIDEEVDSDADGLSDILEELIGTDISKDDTDGDGLSDDQELYLVGTDPIEFDSNNNGISDADDDEDNDGLSNILELSINTDPNLSDTDNDGLSDYDEHTSIGTDPTLYDTDGDGISDGDEVFLGLDPLNPCTDGVTPDAMRKFDQTLGEDNVDESLYEENLVIPSVTGTVSDNMDNHVYLSEERIYETDDNRAVIGKQVYVENDYADGSTVTLSFDCSAVSESINNLIICEFTEDGFEPCETTISGSTISANVTDGKYMVVDAVTLLRELGIPIDKYLSGAYAAEAASAYSMTPDLIAMPKPSPSNDVPAEWYEENYIQTGENEYILSGTENNVIMPIDLMPFAVSEGTASGQADIIFIIDSTGSMSSAIRNVVNNVEAFVDILASNYSVSTNFALIDFKDITEDEETVLIKNGASNWFTDVISFKNKVNSIYVDGGGDSDETPIDALGLAYNLDFRQSADKFVILITDANYKNDNNYGIESMGEMAAMFAANGIVVSVVSDTDYKSDYNDLFTLTGGIFADIYGNFSDALAELAQNIGEIVNDGSWVILNDFQFIKLGQPLDNSGFSSDADPLPDIMELGSPITRSVMPYIAYVLSNYDIPEGMYDDPSDVIVYNYISNPILDDTDYDGLMDGVDDNPKDGTFKGKLKGYLDIKNAVYDFDYTNFFESNTKYNQDLCDASLVFSNTIYENTGFEYDNGQNAPNISALMRHHGFENVIDYKLAEGYNANGINVSAYKDDDISEIVIGFHDVTYKGITKTILGVIIRGTNGTIEEWSSNFDMGNPSDWKEEYHKGFYITEERIHDFVLKYVQCYLSDRSNIAYWVTGHSRGAALANILASRLIDEGKNVFAYTFATPSTTVKSSMHDAIYNPIFNFANTSDIMPYVPLEKWGFGRFGITKSKSLESSGLEDIWLDQTGSEIYNAPNKNVMTVVINRLAKSCASKWEEVFTFDASFDISVEDYNKLSSRAKKYCKMTERKFLWKCVGYKLYPNTAFVLQLLADSMCGDVPPISILIELLKSKYIAVFLALAFDGVKELDLREDVFCHEIKLSLIGDGHATATYYVLTHYNNGGGGFR